MAVRVRLVHKLCIVGVLALLSTAKLMFRPPSNRQTSTGDGGGIGGGIDGGGGESRRIMAETLPIPQQVNTRTFISLSEAASDVRIGNTTIKKDLPIRFLMPDGSRIDPELYSIYKSNHRVKGHSGHMKVRRQTDDYRFCVKVAPFLGPFNYTKASKNPCWYDHTKTFRCVPFFYVAGVSKSGTSDVYERIVKHPDVFHDGKEKHYFDYKRYLNGGKDSSYFYSKFFESFSKQVIDQIDKAKYSKIVTGDGSPCYFFFSFYWPCYEGNQGLTAPRYTNADVIHHLYPGARIILAFRDPVSRLFSRYRTHVASNETSRFVYHQRVSRAVELYQACFREWSHRHCAYNGTLYAITKMRLQEGMYSVYLEDWLNVFPRDQIFIYKFEEYANDVRGHMDQIYDFLGLAPLPNSTIITGRKNKRKTNDSPQDRTVDLLQKFYSPFNRALRKLLDGDDRWSWPYDVNSHKSN